MHQPVLHCCSTQKDKVPLDDVIGLCQPLLPVLQGQLGFSQVTTRFLIISLGQPSIGDAQSPQPLLVLESRDKLRDIIQIIDGIQNVNMKYEKSQKASNISTTLDKRKDDGFSPAAF